MESSNGGSTEYYSGIRGEFLPWFYVVQFISIQFSCEFCCGEISLYGIRDSRIGSDERISLLSHDSCLSYTPKTVFGMTENWTQRSSALDKRLTITPSIWTSIEIRLDFSTSQLPKAEQEKVNARQIGTGFFDIDFVGSPSDGLTGWCDSSVDSLTAMVNWSLVNHRLFCRFHAQIISNSKSMVRIHPRSLLDICWMSQSTPFGRKMLTSSLPWGIP